jgi:DNA-binding LacI/PurR family transcriptional regulator
MDDFFPRFLSGCERAFAEAGVGVMLNLATDAAMEEAIYRSFADGRVDGVILLDVTEPDPRLSLVEELGLPAVALLPYVRGPGRTPSVPSVHTDDATAIQDLVRGLVARGHERIAHVAGPPHFTHARVRRRAFISTMEELSLTADLVVEGDFTPASGREATVTLLERSDRPTAIVYANDAMAHAGMSRAQSLGLDVPGDLSITGFGDEELSAHLSPPLTTVEVGADVSGEAVARLLLDTIDGRAVTHQQLDCVHTVDRLSVAPPRTERPAVPDEAEALARGAEGDAAM